jgi:hypothetical protein
MGDEYQRGELSARDRPVGVRSKTNTAWQESWLAHSISSGDQGAQSGTIRDGLSS